MGIRIIKETTFLFVFSTYLLVFLLKFLAGELSRCRIKFRIQRVPTLHTHHHVFSGISCFWGSGARQKYVEWVLVGCGIKFRIPRALSIEIWVKTQGYMSKIRIKKVVFFMIPIPKFILKNCLSGAPYLNFKAFWLANTWWHGICIIFGRPIFNWNFL